MKELHKLSKLIFLLHLGIAIVLYFFSIKIALGCFIGNLAIVLNLQILGRSWAPFILKSRCAFLTVIGMIGSFLFLGLLAFLIVQNSSMLLLGFAFSFAILPISSCLYAYQFMKSKPKEM